MVDESGETPFPLLELIVGGLLILLGGALVGLGAVVPGIILIVLGALVLVYAIVEAIMWASEVRDRFEKARRKQWESGGFEGQIRFLDDLRSIGSFPISIIAYQL